MLTDNELLLSTLAADGNTGLAKQALEAMYTHRIEKISKAYMSVSLDKLTTLVNGGYTSDTMQKKLIQMNIQGTILAKINDVSGLVTFYDLSTKFVDSVAYLSSMRSQLTEAAMLSTKLRNLHGEVLSSDRFLKKSVAAVVGKGEGVGGGAAGISLVDHDVDMMDDHDHYD
mgnify:CR=1 FL=1